MHEQTITLGKRAIMIAGILWISDIFDPNMLQIFINPKVNIITQQIQPSLQPELILALKTDHSRMFI